jgi:hypothetical protein
MILLKENMKKGLVEFVCLAGCTGTPDDEFLF